MADFLKAYAHLRDVEGHAANNPHDYGGRTYAGISKRYHPNWPGWALLDRINDAGSTPGLAQALDESIEMFYLDEYWSRVNGDALTSDAVATELLEAAVHTNPKTAAEWLQTSLNVWNRRGTRWPDIAVDGDIGPATLDALSNAVAVGREADIVRGQNVEQACYLWGRMKADPSQEEFTGGWMMRAGQ